MPAHSLGDERLAVSPQEAARLLGCSRAHIYNLIQDNVIPSVLLGRRRLIKRAALVALLEHEESA